jgi:hypothetical protein
MARHRYTLARQKDGMLVAGLIAAVAATALIFFAAYQTPIRHDAASKPPRAVVNATEEWKVWSHKPTDDR